MVEPERFLEYMRSSGKLPTFTPPNGVVLCYQRSLMAHITTQHRTTRCDGFLSDLLLLDDTNGSVGVLGNFGFGAPCITSYFEKLIAFGVKKFISVGWAGTLQKNIQIGDIVVCDKAIRDDGTSHHYIAPSKYAFASPDMTRRLATTLENLKVPFTVGTTWTTDAPYRETLSEAKLYQSEGVATVEMEAAALFAVAEYRKVEAGAMFIVSDSLADLSWHPEFYNEKTTIGLEMLYRAATHCLL
ncbi:nucleoside phosphorylase [Bdellovibrionota bacterium FG-1]